MNADINVILELKKCLKGGNVHRRGTGCILRFWKSQELAWPYVLQTRHPALFMEMRLGKCLVTTRCCRLYEPLNARRGFRGLVVCPSSAFSGWLEAFAADGEDALLLPELTTKKRRKEALAAFNHSWYVLHKEGHRTLPEIARLPWDAVVLDESTFIKNVKASVTKFYLRNFRRVPHRWILTGTPNPENNLEYWAQFAWLDGHAFGYHDFWSWRAREWHPAGFDWFPNRGVAKEIEEYVAKRAFVLRRRDVGMGSKTILERRIVEMPPKIRKLYSETEETFVRPDGVSTLWQPVKFTWLRQLSSGLIDGKVVWPGKIDALCELLCGELRRDPVVVWFAYNDELAAVREALRKNKVTAAHIWGRGMKQAERLEQIRRFQRGRVRVMLAQVECGKMGSDFSCADTAVYFSLPAGGESYIQSRDRLVRGNKTTPSLLISLLTKDTVDEDCHFALAVKNLRSKRDVAGIVALRMRERKK